MTADLCGNDWNAVCFGLVTRGSRLTSYSLKYGRSYLWPGEFGD